MSLQTTNREGGFKALSEFLAPMGQHTILLMGDMMHGLTVCPERLRINTHASYTRNHLHTLNLTQCEINCVGKKERKKNNTVRISYDFVGWLCFFFFDSVLDPGVKYPPHAHYLAHTLLFESCDSRIQSTQL